MKLQRKGTRHSHRGVIGVESAIVMIAFVIVAAALAFVVLNMGFTTSQKAKTTIIAGLGESGSSLQLSGKVTGVGCTGAGGGCDTTPYLNATAFPIKITAGGDSVDLAKKIAPNGRCLPGTLADKVHLSKKAGQMAARMYEQV